MGNFDNYYKDKYGNEHRDIPLGTSPADAYVRTNMKLKKEVQRIDNSIQETNEHIDAEISRMDEVVVNAADGVSKQLENTVNEINESIGEVSDSIDTKIASEIAGINSRVDNIIANSNDAEGNSELIDIRTGADGTVYASAGAAVRNQIGSLNTCAENLQQLAAIADDIRNKNLIPGNEYADGTTSGTLTIQCYPYYSGITVSGEMTAYASARVFKPQIHLTHGQKYTLYVATDNGAQEIAIRVYGATMGGNNVVTTLKSEPYIFIPDEDTNEATIYFNRNRNSSLNVGGTYYIYLVEGEYDMENFDFLKYYHKVSSETKTALQAYSQDTHDILRTLGIISLDRYNWQIGSMTNGVESVNTKRIRSEYIPVSKGDSFIGSSYEFTVSEFSGLTPESYVGVSNYTLQYTVQHDGYARLIFHNADSSAISESDLLEIPASVALMPHAGHEKRIQTAEQNIEELKGDEFLKVYSQEISALFEKVKSNMDENTIVFAVTTDNHYGIHTGTQYQVEYASHYRQLSEKLGVDFQLNLGDLINEAETAGQEKTVNRRRISEMIAAYTDTYLPFIYAVAHHEGYPYLGVTGGKSVYTFAKSKTLGLAGRYNRYLKKVCCAFDTASFFIDFPEQELRLIVIDSTSYYPVGFNSDVIDFVEQQALGTAPNGYKVLFASHAPTRASANWDGYIPYNGDKIETAINNYISGGGTVLGYIHGHTHWDNIVKENDMAYPLISVCCAKTQRMDTAAHGTSKGVVGDPTSYERAEHTISAYCCDIFCVHADTGRINMFRFGAGSDRGYTPEETA